AFAASMPILPTRRPAEARSRLLSGAVIMLLGVSAVMLTGKRALGRLAGTYPELKVEQEGLAEAIVRITKPASVLVLSTNIGHIYPWAVSHDIRPVGSFSFAWMAGIAYSQHAGQMYRPLGAMEPAERFMVERIGHD